MVEIDRSQEMDWRRHTNPNLPSCIGPKKKRRYGCPNCFKKTYVKFDLGEECPNCGEIVGITYYFQSKAQLLSNGEGQWVRCPDESTCLKMAEKGFKVKKVVLEPDPE